MTSRTPHRRRPPWSRRRGGLALAALGAASVEVLWPLHGRQRPARAWATDLVHAVGNRTITLPVSYAALTVLGPMAAWLVPGPVRSGVQALPWWLQVVVVLILGDLAGYGTHRALHRVPLLWRLHAVHHSSEHLDWLATARAHPLDQALSVVITALPGLALAGGGELPWALGLFFLYYPFLSHADAALRLPGLDRVLVTPRFHHWHHAAEPGMHHANFGGFLSVWDHLFGTVHQPAGHPDRYGIGDPVLAGADHLGHLLAPITRRARAGRVARWRSAGSTGRTQEVPT